MVAKPATPLVANIGAPSVNSNRGTAGSAGKGLQGLGAGVTSAGNTLMDRALLDAAEENERQIKDAETQYKAARSLVLYGDGSAQNPGYLSLQGQPAIDARPGVDQAILDAQAEGLKGISRKEAAQGYMQLTAGDVTLSTTKANAHVSQQRKVASTVTAKARQEQARSDAATNYNQGTAEVNKYIRISMSEARSAAKYQGFSDENADHAARMAGSDTAAAAVQAAIDKGDVAMATDLLGVYSAKGESGQPVIEGGTAAALAEKLEDESVLQEVQGETDRIAAMGLTGAQMLKQARQIKDPRVRKGVEQAIGVRNVEAVAAQREAHDQAVEMATTHVNDGGAYADLPKDVRDTLTPGEAAGYRRLELQVASKLPAETNWDAFNEWTSWSTEDLAGFPIEQAQEYLAPKQFGILQGMVIQARKDLADGIDEDPTFTITQEMNARADQIKGSKDRGIFKTQFMLEIAAIEKRTGAKVGVGEQQRVLDAMVEKVVVADYYIGLFNSEQSFHEVAVPDDDREKITTRFFDREGRAPSEFELKQEYVQFTQDNE